MELESTMPLYPYPCTACNKSNDAKEELELNTMAKAHIPRMKTQNHPPQLQNQNRNNLSIGACHGNIATAL